jgi:hypothetical protein
MRGGALNGPPQSLIWAKIVEDADKVQLELPQNPQIQASSKKVRELNKSTILIMRR